MASAQRHIHLSTALGGAPENAPTHKWVATEVLPVPEIIASVSRTLNGTLQKHAVIRDGQVVRLRNMKYKLRLGSDPNFPVNVQIDVLTAMQGADVFLVEHVHPADGEDHTAFVRKMYVESVGALENIDPGLNHYLVEISLIDDRFRE